MKKSLFKHYKKFLPITDKNKTRFSLTLDEGVDFVIKSLDKSMAPVACLDNSETCQISGNCAQQNMWSEVEETLISKLEMITIKDLADKEKPIVDAVKLEK